jgi:hypothetical protein
MHHWCGGKAYFAIIHAGRRTLAILLLVYELAIAQKYPKVIVRVAMHQGGLIGFNRDVIHADEQIVEHVMMMRFRAHVNRLLLGETRKPREQKGSK